MGNLSQRNRPVINEHYALVPKSHVPRATFNRPHEFKFTCQSGYLIPILCDEVLPGDVHTGQATIFARLADLIFPLMDNLTVETQFFFVPMRLVWEHSQKFFGEQQNPGDSIAYVIPTISVTAADAPSCGIYDYFGIPGENMLAAAKSINALPFRCYNRIYNEWYRDQNLTTSIAQATGDGPDNAGDYELKRRAKKHDYFTSCLPAPQRGAEVAIPLGSVAPVRGIAWDTTKTASSGSLSTLLETANTPSSGPGVAATYTDWFRGGATDAVVFKANTVSGFHPQIYADLSSASAASINTLRLAIQTQKLLETDARFGTRYVEQLRGRWGINPQDARLQRPEYIGGGVSHVNVTAIAQTSPDSVGSHTALGSLAGQGTVGGQHSFTCVGYEHGYIIGLMSIMSRPTYQQGIHRMFTRSTRYDFATPEFVGLGEQTVRNDEIYATGGANDALAFGYQERYGEYRFSNNRIAGMFRSTVTGNIDEWHVAQQFSGLPALNTAFIIEAAPLDRVLAAGAAVNKLQLLCDISFKIKSTRPLPAYGIPGGNMGF